MYSTLAVHFLPTLTSAEELAAGVVVMVDVLRASTTITAALASGAKEVIPCLEIDEARQKKAAWKETPQSP
jgi:2-phosphosulfolactate phosphatase